MPRCIAALVALLLASCATVPDAPRDTQRHARFFDDARFAPASERIGADQVFAMNDDMRRYVEEEIAPRTKARAVSSHSSTRSRRRATSSSSTTRR